MKIVIKRPRPNAEEITTEFVRVQMVILDRLVKLPPNVRRPVQWLEGPVRSGSTRWAERYPRGRVFHIAIRTAGIVRQSETGLHACSHPGCQGRELDWHPIPSDWPEAEEPVIIGQEHHADLVLPDDPTKEELRRLDERVMIHATTPVFHPNIGNPEHLYCLAMPKSDWTIEAFLDQFIAIAGWHRDVVNLHDVRDQPARAYFEKLQKSSAWPSALLPERSHRVYGAGLTYLLS